MPKLPDSFYTHADVVHVSKALLGKYLVTNIDGQLTSGIIVETEAYCGRGDKACHANYKRTPRTEIMYQSGGVAYVYLCYGIHYLFNVVTNVENLADAVLVRAIEPVEGIESMLARRNMKQLAKRITAGPGCLTQALGINKLHYGANLNGGTVWIEDRGKVVNETDIMAGPRIGVDYAGDDALLPWRFWLRDNKYVSK